MRNILLRIFRPWDSPPYFWHMPALPYGPPILHSISIDASELASQSAHPCPVSKSLQPPEHDNHLSLLKHFPILIASFSRRLSHRLKTWPVEAGSEVSL